MSKAQESDKQLLTVIENPPEYPGFHGQSQRMFIQPQQTGYFIPPSNGYISRQQQNSNDYNMGISYQPVATRQAVVPPYTNYLPAAVFVCLCCFWPTGIAAIVEALVAQTAKERGDLQEASRASRIARNLVIISLVIGIVLFICIIIYKVASFIILYTKAYNKYN